MTSIDRLGLPQGVAVRLRWKKRPGRRPRVGCHPHRDGGPQKRALLDGLTVQCRPIYRPRSEE